MADVLFYHLERARLENVLPGLLERILQNNWTATVRTVSQEGVAKIDELLWVFSDQSFLPHGMSDQGEGHPVWITHEAVLKKESDLLFLVNGASAEVSEIEGLKRCISIFDGGDAEAIIAARTFWKLAKEASHEVTYWKQSPAGKWEKQG